MTIKIDPKTRAIRRVGWSLASTSSSISLTSVNDSANLRKLWEDKIEEIDFVSDSANLRDSLGEKYEISLHTLRICHCLLSNCHCRNNCHCLSICRCQNCIKRLPEPEEAWKGQSVVVPPNLIFIALIKDRSWSTHTFQFYKYRNWGEIDCIHLSSCFSLFPASFLDSVDLSQFPFSWCLCPRLTGVFVTDSWYLVSLTRFPPIQQFSLHKNSFSPPLSPLQIKTYVSLCVLVKL